ncbi:MAG: tetratricopeptide repeat protein [Cyclobacteriaceae bacterium]
MTLDELKSKSYRVLLYDLEEQYSSTISQLNHDPAKNTHAYNNLALAYFESGDFDNAIVNFNLSVERDPDNAVAFVNRGDLHQKWGKQDLADGDYSCAIELVPTNATYWRCRAYLRKECGRIAEALSDFQKALELEPRFEATMREIATLKELLRGV